MTGPAYAFFGINPSTASATEDDATVRKWTGFVKTWGGSRYMAGNVFPLRSTDVRAVAKHLRWQDVENANRRHILEMSQEADILVPCWGDRAKVPRQMHNEIDALLSLLIATRKPVMHLGRTKGGDPKHPLMLGYSTPLERWPWPDVKRKKDSS